MTPREGMQDGRQKEQEGGRQPTMTLHNTQKLDHNLGGRPDQNLALSTAFGVDDVVQAVVLHHHQHLPKKNGKGTYEDGYANHFILFRVFEERKCWRDE